MKSTIKELFACVIITIIMPLLLFNAWRAVKNLQNSNQPKPNITPDSTSLETLPTEILTHILVLLDDGTVSVMDLEEYLLGVVTGEMPSDFDIEALKAQAVVSRTYALRSREYGSKHPDADVCTDSTCCQRYVNNTAGGYDSKIQKAVLATKGLILTYENQLIEATYFASSGGRTEDAVAVWGNDVPYLKSTESPEDEYIQQQVETRTLTVREFLDSLSLLAGSVDIHDITYTAGGGVDMINICGTEFRGTQVRKLLNLPSTMFYITVIDDHVLITSKGHGHRVGMSQYGAEAMAVDGATYEEILLHYYLGTTLEYFVDKGSPIG